VWVNDRRLGHPSVVVVRRAIPSVFAEYVPPAVAELRVPAYVVDVTGRIRWLNEAADALVGDAVGKPLSTVVDLDEESARRIFEANLRSAKGHERTIDLRFGPRRTRVQLCSARLGDEHHVVGMFGLAIPRVDQPRPRPRHSPLTPRQHEVLALLAQGASTEQIAQSLTVTETTVRNYVREILRRLGVGSRLAAVAVARERNLV
jgi:DNA-binding CsgD family transcriptional regulator